MTLSLSENAEIQLQKDHHTISLILEIDGYDTIYTSCSLLKRLEYGDDVDYGEAGLYYGGTVADPRGSSLINLSKSKNALTQQLEQDRGSAQGVTSMAISIVDKSEQLTEAFSPGGVVNDPLGVNARVYIGINNSAHPADTILLLSGIIQEIEFGCADCKIVVGSPEQKKRAKIYEVITTNLDGSITDSDTSITVNNTTGIFEDQDALTTYIQIEDEIIKIGSISGNTFTGCTRGQFDTLPASHDDDTDVESRYRFQGLPIDLALKMMMSGAGDLLDPIAVVNFVGTYGNNDILINKFDFVVRSGLVEGDLVTITGATNAANNFSGRFITEITEVPLGTIITVSGAALTPELATSAEITFQSKYDTLPQGLELNSLQCDVEQHEFLSELLAGDFPAYDLFLKETIDGMTTLHEQIYFPAGLYSIPRKGKASCNITLPPLALNKIFYLTDCNVKNADKLRIKRSINKFFYNAVVWKYDPDQVEEKFKAGVVTLSQASKNRIDIPNRPLTIEADGFRSSGTVENFINIQSRRFLDRYQFAAESIKVETLFSVGFPIEVGDAVVFGENLKVTDINNKSRNFTPRLMEVVQKSLNVKNCNVEFVLVDTKVGLQARFGVIAPSSPVNQSLSTASKLCLNNSETLGVTDTEREKWEDYIGFKISVHDLDWNVEEEVTLVGFDGGSDNCVLIDPPLSFSFDPNFRYVIDAPTYPDDTNPKEQFIWKELHVYTDAAIDVVSGISDTQFTIGAGDLDKVFLGVPVGLHDPDYNYTTQSAEEEEMVITDITGTTITVSRSIGLTPSLGDIMELNGFPDNGFPYRYI